MDARLLALLAALIGAAVGYFTPWPVLLVITLVLWPVAWIYLTRVGKKYPGTEAGIGSALLCFFILLPLLGLAWVALIFRVLLIS